MGGRCSPLDGIAQRNWYPYLIQRLSDGKVQEVILATNATVEGQATARSLVEATKRLPIQMTRIARVYHGWCKLNMWIVAYF